MTNMVSMLSVHIYKYKSTLCITNIMPSRIMVFVKIQLCQFFACLLHQNMSICIFVYYATLSLLQKFNSYICSHKGDITPKTKLK